MANRYDARYCSSTCRKNADRAEKALGVAQGKLIKDIELFTVKFATGARKQDRLDLVDALIAIRKRIDALLERYDY